jgi:hypothetical protein
VQLAENNGGQTETGDRLLALLEERMDLSSTPVAESDATQKALFGSENPVLCQKPGERRESIMC